SSARKGPPGPPVPAHASAPPPLGGAGAGGAFAAEGHAAERGGSRDLAELAFADLALRAELRGLTPDVSLVADSREDRDRRRGVGHLVARGAREAAEHARDLVHDLGVAGPDADEP